MPIDRWDLREAGGEWARPESRSPAPRHFAAFVTMPLPVHAGAGPTKRAAAGPPATVASGLRGLEDRRPALPLRRSRPAGPHTWAGRTSMHPRAPATHRRPGCSGRSALDKTKRAQGMPGEGLTHGPPANKKQAAGTTGSADHPAFPARWFIGCFAISLVRRACWPPSPV